jgi:hypothetical protein
MADKFDTALAMQMAPAIRAEIRKAHAAGHPPEYVIESLSMACIGAVGAEVQVNALRNLALESFVECVRYWANFGQEISYA